jgi:hypothetical protein
MKATFAEDFEKEKARLAEYAEIKAPEGMLAAIDMGFGVGAVPQMGGAAQSPSAVTAVPTMMPINTAPNTQTAGTSPGLPPIVRPVPPTLAPASSPPVRPPSLTSMPRLTAVAPMLTSGKEEHESTVLADAAGGSNPFDEPATNPGNARQDPTRAFNIRNKADPVGGGEIATDPGRPAMARPGPPVVEPPRKITRGMPAAPPPPPMMSPSDTSPTLSAVQYQQTANTLAPIAQPAPQPATGGSNTKLIIALAAIVALLVVGVVGVVLLKPPPTGLLMITVPDGVATTATVSVNGKPLTEKEWPQIIPVTVGKATVMIKAPGYDPLIETVEVREGNEPAQLKQELKKKP